VATIHEVLTVEHVEVDVFRGSSPDTSMQRTFGGQVAAQALVAAVHTVRDGMQVHSLHGYFLRPGQPKAPTTYQVPGPESLATVDEEADAVGAWFKREWPDWDIRIVPAADVRARPGIAAQQRVWIRYRHALPPDPVFHVCVLAYMSDMTLLGSARVPHPYTPIQGASLDHALWFLRPFRADDWLLYDQTSPSAGYGRALTQGRIFDRAGHLVAAVVQEGLMRTER